MDFFFPDSQDQIDPSFDFVTEQRSRTRIRQRDDQYAHEVFQSPPYTGMLVSRSMVDLETGSGSRYSLPQRQRLHRLGVRRFFRLHGEEHKDIKIMGDCGAFSYVEEKEPPYTVSNMLEFYESCRFDLGVSVDHIILNFDASFDTKLPGTIKIPEAWTERQEITLDLADEFLQEHRSQSCGFTPIGVAQGWSPLSYAESVKALQKMGYDYIGLGGMVPMKTDEILATLKAVDTVRNDDTKLHLFGISRHEHALSFVGHGVASIDSTSPFRKAFKSADQNYYTPDGYFAAIRVPQVDGNAKLKSMIKAGKIDQDEASKLEEECRDVLRQFDRGDASVEEALEALSAYEEIWGGTRRAKHDRSAGSRALLEKQPWKSCPCDICQELGIEVVIFRGAERNKRRGFHNLYVFSKQLREVLDE